MAWTMRGVVHMLLLSLATLMWLTAANDFVTIDMYRAIVGSEAELQEFTNNGLADIPGALKYIHTEVIVESAVSPPDRKKRKNDVDSVVRAAFKVKNPVGHPNQMVDFAPFAAFDQGQLTSAIQDDAVSKHGDYVGVQKQHGHDHFAYNEPFYWFSLSGFCPNLPWAANAQTGRCPSGSPCLAKGDPTSPAETCLKYDVPGAPEDKTFVKGGHCAPDVQEPTGALGCAYTYSDKKTIVLDKLTGITNEDCATGKCKDWEDFRYNCKNPDYKFKFTHEGVKESVSYCVEYDMNPKCTSCDKPECKQPEAELGLPFWRGRCDGARNRERAELMAKEFGIDDSTTNHELLRENLRVSGTESKTCKLPGHHECEPSSDGAGPYCTRQWAGVCQTCYIPNTVMGFADDSQPLCPLDIFETSDYEAQHTINCKIDDKLCALYVKGSKPAGPEEVTLDDNGMALIGKHSTAMGDEERGADVTARMEIFLSRVMDNEVKEGRMTAGEVKTLKGTEDFKQMAYQSWGPVPLKLSERPERGLALIVKELKAVAATGGSDVVESTTSTTTVSATTTTTIAATTTTTLSATTATTTTTTVAATTTTTIVGATTTTTVAATTTTTTVEGTAETTTTTGAAETSTTTTVEGVAKTTTTTTAEGAAGATTTTVEGAAGTTTTTTAEGAAGTTTTTLEGAAGTTTTTKDAAAGGGLKFWHIALVVGAVILLVIFGIWYCKGNEPRGVRDPEAGQEMARSNSGLDES